MRRLLQRLSDAVLLNLTFIFGYHIATLVCRTLEVRRTMADQDPETASKIYELIRALSFN